MQLGEKGNSPFLHYPIMASILRPGPHTVHYRVMFQRLSLVVTVIAHLLKLDSVLELGPHIMKLPRGKARATGSTVA